MQNVIAYIHIDSMKIKIATKIKIKGECSRYIRGGEQSNYFKDEKLGLRNSNSQLLVYLPILVFLSTIWPSQSSHT